MIAPRRRNDSGHIRTLPAQPVHIGQATTNLESAGRRMVLVLHPYFHAGTRGQQWPGIGRRSRKTGMDQIGRSLQRAKIEHPASSHAMAAKPRA